MTTKLMYREISEELRRSAELKLNEVASRVEDDVAHIRNWMEKQPHLNFKIDDQLILSFLRCSKFSLERTKEKIDNHYTIKTIMPEFFSNRDPFLPEMQHLLDAGAIIPLPRLDPDDGSRIVLNYFSSHINPNICTLLDLSKLNCMVADLILREDDHAVINGIKVVMYSKDLNLKYLLQMTPSHLRKCAHIIEKGLPFRTLGICMTHCPPPFAFVYDLMKLLFSKKISERITMVTEEKMEELLREKPHLLPTELGGNNGSINDLIVTWKKKIKDYKEAFLSDEKLKTDESLRTVPKALFDPNSIEGSFRQLTVD